MTVGPPGLGPNLADTGAPRWLWSLLVLGLLLLLSGLTLIRVGHVRSKTV